jgi:hypothetical protein
MKATQSAPPQTDGFAAAPPIDKKVLGQEVAFFAVGLTAVGYAAALAVIGDNRNIGTLDTETTRRFLVAASVIAGTAYLVGLCSARGRPARSRDMIIILAVGLVARVVLIPSAPVFVSDFYRYLWDGAVTASGANPWTNTPKSVNSALGDGENAPDVSPELVELAGKSGRVIHRINHPHLSTIYPATAQAAFAIAYWIKPWSVAALRCVLLFFDLSTVLILAAILRAINRPVYYIAWYWWNPLLLREVSHSAHMDVIALPFVLLGFLFAVKGRCSPAGAAMALAVGAKVWPLVLLPLCIRAASRQVREALVMVVAFVAVSAVLWWPVVDGATTETTGFLAYAASWYNNDAVFHMITRLVHHGLSVVSVDAGFASILSRLVVVSLIAWVVLAQSRSVTHGLADLTQRSLLVMAVVYFLCPAQFPWYYAWLVPLLALHPRSSLLMYTALLPLYYFSQSHPWITWIEHLPVLGWFAIEAFRAKVDRPVLPLTVRRNVQLR